MTIYEALRNDHMKVTQLMNELIALSPGEEIRKDLIDQIRDELIPHSRAEESVFYNPLRSIPQAKDLVMHSYKEHMEAESLLRLLQVKNRVDADWKETAQKLKQALSHHIQEEEGEIFSVAKKYISHDEATMMAEAFERLKPEVRDDGFMKTSMELVANLMPPRFTSVFRNQHFDLRK